MKGDAGRRLTDEDGWVDEWKKEIRGREGGSEGLGCLALVVEEETLQTQVEVERKGFGDG